MTLTRLVCVSSNFYIQPSEILNFSFLGNIIGKYIGKHIEICSIHVKQKGTLWAVSCLQNHKVPVSRKFT